MGRNTHALETPDMERCLSLFQASTQMQNAKNIRTLNSPKMNDFRGSSHRTQLSWMGLSDRSLPNGDDDASKPLLTPSSQQFRISTLTLMILVLGLIICGATTVTYIQVGGGGASASVTVREKENCVVEADNGVVASDDERCSIVGRDVLRKGGHAVDAAVATALCEGVVNPMASGIGGGSFMLLRLSNGSVMAYDMREVAPAAASQDMYANDPTSKFEGPLSIGVPGELAGLQLAWQHHGKLPWKSLFQPAIELARDGFRVSPYLSKLIGQNQEKIKAYKDLFNMLAPNGTLVGTGDLLHRQKLGDTLTVIAEQGINAFYNGSIGQSLASEIQAAGGILTFKDLQNYKVEIREPIVADVLGFTLLGMPPPSSGGATITLILRILSMFNDLKQSGESLHVHRMIEAFKHAYAVRMNLADPAFHNVSDVVDEMLSMEFAAQLHKKIRDNTTFPPDYYGSRWLQLEDHGTCHFGIVDTQRNALALTTTVNYAFGSKIVSPSTGILLNNEMDDFAVPTHSGDVRNPPVNFVQPLKRPLSSMSPTILLQNGQLRAVMGASGGIRIITGTVQVFLNHFLRGYDPLTAVTKARVHHQLVPNVVECENETVVSGEHLQVREKVKEGLIRRGHQLVDKSSFCITQFVVHSLTVPANTNLSLANQKVYMGKLIGVSDMRKDGSPAGF